LEGGLQELEESQYWFELLVESDILRKERLVELYAESEELKAILITCVLKAKKRKEN
jgi:four helix bundle protein